MIRPTTSARLLRPFAIDVRSLAALRIALGLIAIYDSAIRLGVLRLYFTDEGVSPRNVFLSGPMKWQTFFSINGSFGFALLLLIAHALLALVFTIGFHTRIVTILFFASSWSLINRNPLLASGGHSLAAWLLVWSIFLPLGAVASIDAKRHRRSARMRVASIASLAILMQVSLMYWNAVSVKTTPEWRSDFSAVYYNLNSHLATPLGHAIGQSTALCKTLTIGTLALELFGPILALVSFNMPRTRTAVVLTFIGFHLGLAATMYVGSFAFICIAAWLLFIPTAAWDRIVTRRRRPIVPTQMRALARWPQAIAGVLFVYVLLIHIMQILPRSVSSHLGPIARLPKFKQNWGMMDTAWKYFLGMSLEAELVDGTVQTITPAQTPDDFYNYSTWWNETTFTIGYRSTLVLDAITKEPATLKAYCDYHRRRWNESHPSPQQQVKSIALYAQIVETPAPDAVRTSARRRGKQLLYSWPESTGAERGKT